MEIWKSLSVLQIFRLRDAMDSNLLRVIVQVNIGYDTNYSTC